jgi:hypothetical protein
MPGHVLHATASVQCAHAAPAQLAATGVRLLLGGQAAALAGDKAVVTGCPFQVPAGAGTKPQPCATVEWTMPAARVRSGGKAVLLNPSPSLCRSGEQIPQGPGSVLRQQTRVRAT